MGTFKAFDEILNGYEAQEIGCGDADNGAKAYARNVVWCDVGVTDQTIGYSSCIDIVDGVGVHYDYAADYYFFTDEGEE